MDSCVKMFSQTRQLFPMKDCHSNGNRCQREKLFKASSLSAIKFLMLREKGQTFKNAINFTTKRFCRYDNTQIKDGTKNFRVFKRKQKDTKCTHYGWVMNSQPQVVSALPDISHIIKNCDAQDKLISSIMKSKVQSNIPKLQPYH